MVLDIQNVSIKYPGSSDYILRDINLKIEEGEFVCLLGPSGCGKSSLLGAIAGFIQPNQGKVLHRGELVRRPDLSRTLVFQEYALFPWLNVLENVAFGLKFLVKNQKERLEIASEYLRKVGLIEHAQDSIFQLSGGMKQRVALARALAPKPDILLMDEPFGALDDRTRSDMQNQLISIYTDLKPAVIFVTHSVDEALKLADRIVIIAKTDTLSNHQSSNMGGEIKADIIIPNSRPRNLLDLQDYRNIAMDAIYARSESGIAFDAMI